MNKARTCYTIFLLGFFSLVTQIFLFRELYNIFSGNELVIGIILSIWFFSSAFGNLLSKKFSALLEKKIYTVFFINLNLFLLEIIFIRNFFRIFPFSFGEIIPMFYITLVSFITILPVSILWAVNFNYLYIAVSGFPSPESRSYFWESIGAAAGSLLTTFILIKLNSVFMVIVVCYCLLLTALLWEKQIRTVLFVVSSVIIIFLILFQENINLITLHQQYENLNICRIRETPYGRLTAGQYKNSYSFYQNNIRLFSTDDTVTSEINTDLALAEAAAIHNVLLINNGFNGILEKLLAAENVRNVYYLEPNIYLVYLYLDLFKPRFIKNPKLQIIHNDIRNIIHNKKIKFNIIFINTGDPFNLQLNRYMTREFYRDLRSIMNPDGILIFAASGSETFYNKFQSLYLGSLYNTLQSVFKDVLIIPGETCYFLACPRKGILTYDQGLITDRLWLREIDSSYFVNYFLKPNFNEFRLQSLINIINHDSRINRDLQPIAFFYNMVLWTTRTSQNIKNIFLSLYQIKFVYILLFFLILFLTGYFSVLRKQENSILASMGIIGLTEISLEIIILFLYQVLRGSLYENIGLIFFSFMLGLAAGSYLFPFIKTETRQLLKNIQFLFIVLPLIVIPLYEFIKLLYFPWLQDIVFLTFILIFSTLSGLQFPAAVSLFSDRQYAPGRINSMDLSGAGLGALLISLFFIPLYGIFHTCLFLMFLNIMGYLALCKNKIV